MKNPPNQIERSELLALLEQWNTGSLKEVDVHERAEALMAELEDLPNYGEDDPRSIPIEALVQLDALNHQLITQEDIPAFRAFLQTPHGMELHGWSTWRNYWNAVNFERRKLQLQHNPYYNT